MVNNLMDDSSRKVMLLHISDLHFYKDVQTFLMQRILINEVRKRAQELNEDEKLLVVTGDFRNWKTDDYKDATSFLKELIEAMGIEPDKDVFVVPGNHDVANKTMMSAMGISDDQRDEAIQKLKDNDFTQLEARMEMYRPYCEFVRNLGIYPKTGDVFLPARVHVRTWRNRLNILHLNTTLVAKGGQKDNQVADIHGAANDSTWSNLSRPNLPTIAIGHNNFYDLKEDDENGKSPAGRIRTALATTFSLHNVSAYLCGDTHRLSIPPEQLFIPLESIRNQNGLKIPNIVCAKGISDINDTFSDFGIFWHEWEETGTVNARFFRWRREFYEDLHSDAGFDYTYEIQDKQEIALDPDFSYYIDKKFEEYKKKNIAVRIPQLLCWTLKYPDSEALEILNYYRSNGNRCGDEIVQVLEKIDMSYIKEGRLFEDTNYRDYQQLIRRGIHHHAYFLQGEEYISPRLFCSIILKYSNGSTVQLLEQYFEDRKIRFDRVCLHMYNGSPPSVPASFRPKPYQTISTEDLSWINDI